MRPKFAEINFSQDFFKPEKPDVNTSTKEKIKPDWLTPEGIAVKPSYTSEDLKDLNTFTIRLGCPLI
jgi:hypothetical protein